MLPGIDQITDAGFGAAEADDGDVEIAIFE